MYIYICKYIYIYPRHYNLGVSTSILPCLRKSHYRLLSPQSVILWFLWNVKPIPPEKSTQSWLWQFDGFHFRIFFLKEDKVLALLIFTGIKFQITGPKYRVEPLALSNLTELILRTQSFWGPFDLKPYNNSRNCNNSEKLGVERSFNALKISIAKLWILFMNSM